MKQQTNDTLVIGFPDYQAPARRMALCAGVPHADLSVHRFPDGESLVRLPTGLPAHVVLFTSLGSAST